MIHKMVRAPTMFRAVAATISTLFSFSLLMLLTGCGGDGVKTVTEKTVVIQQAPPQPTQTQPSASPPKNALRGPISADGLDPIKIGMTPREAEAASGVRLARLGTGASTCTLFQPSPGGAGASSDVLDGTSFMVISRPGTDQATSGVIARVDIDKPGYKTARGVGVGDSEQLVLSRYGSEVTTSRHRYVEGGHYLTVGTGRRHIILESDGKRITSIRAGREPEVNYIESCA